MKILNDENKTILAVASDSGAALYMVEILKKLKKKNVVKIFSLINAHKTFKLNDIKSNHVKNYNFRVFSKKIINEYTYDYIILGTNLGYGLEKQITLDARKQNILTYAFIDHFWHPWQRFADLKKKIKNIYLPNYIISLDNKQKQILINNRISEKIIYIYNHPYLTKLKRTKISYDKDSVLSDLKINKKNKIFVLASEPFPSKTPLWFSEEPTAKSILQNSKALFETLEVLHKKNKNFTLIIKKHPTEKKDNYGRYYKKISKFTIIINDFKPKNLIDVADQIFGFSSMFLLEAKELGKNVLTLNVNNEYYGNVMNDYGINCVRNKSELLNLLKNKI